MCSILVKDLQNLNRQQSHQLGVLQGATNSLQQLLDVRVPTLEDNASENNNSCWYQTELWENQESFDTNNQLNIYT